MDGDVEQVHKAASAADVTRLFSWKRRVDSTGPCLAQLPAAVPPRMLPRDR